MKKKIISLILVIIMLVGSMSVLTGCGQENSNNSNNDDKKTNEVANESINESSFLKKYEQYLNETFFDDRNEHDNDQIVGGLFDSYTTSDPFLAIKYKDTNNNYVIKIIHIAGDEVKSSNSFSSTGMNYAYNLDDKRLEYFLKPQIASNRYESIEDIISEKKDITELQESDLDSKYILLEDEITFYNIRKSSLKSDLENIETKYTNSDMTEVNDKIKVIENNRLQMDDNGIFNSQYKIPFGTYTCGDSTMTIKNDNSVNVKTRNNWENDGSFYLENDTIIPKVPGWSTSGSALRRFKIIDNSKIQDSRDNKIWSYTE